MSQIGKDRRCSKKLQRLHMKTIMRNVHHLSAKHPDWRARARAIGAQIYQFAMTILIELGNEPNGGRSTVVGQKRKSADPSHERKWRARDRSPSAIGFSHTRKAYCSMYYCHHSKCMESRWGPIESKHREE